MIVKNFGEDLSVVTDEVVKAKIAELLKTDPVEAALLRAAIKKESGVQYRRLRMALGMPTTQVPLNMGNLPYMTDVEVLEGFKALDADGMADFASDAYEDQTPQGERARRVLSKIKEDIDAERQRLADAAEKEAARLRAEELERNRLYLLEHPEELVLQGIPLTDEQAVEFIRKQPWGYFRNSDDLKSAINADGKVISMFSGQPLEVAEVAITRNCFLAEESVIRRLNRLLDKTCPRPGVKREQYIMFPIRVKSLEEKEALRLQEATEQAKALEAERAKANELEALINSKFEMASDLLTLARTYLGVMSEEVKGPDDEWKIDVIVDLAIRREEVLIGEYKSFLKQTYPDGTAIPKLQSYLDELKEQYRSYGARKDAGEVGADKLANKAFILLQIATRHLKWVQDNPEGYVAKADVSVVEFPENRNRRDEQPSGTHRFTKGVRGAPVITKHGDDDAAATRRRNRRNRDAEIRTSARGKSGEQGGQKGGKKKGK